jgi:16S rRNA (uracil1498-N3)-methyltransferase
MSHPRFLVSHHAEPGERVALDRDESKHARVRRVSAGELVEVLDGHGWSALATFEGTTRHAATVRIGESLPARHRESPLDLTLAIGLLKSDRFEWAIEKTTELGVTKIRPFESIRSLGRPSAARQKRWQQIALGAVKQCGRTVPPTIHPPATWAEILGDPTPLRLLCAEHGDAEPLSEIAGRTKQPSAVSIVVGPEGGFDGSEIQAALATGYRAVTLGKRILRAETAAIAAVALCEQMFSRK